MVSLNQHYCKHLVVCNDSCLYIQTGWTHISEIRQYMDKETHYQKARALLNFNTKVTFESELFTYVFSY